MSAPAVCPVCPRHCRLAEGQRGFCRARAAQNGRVVAQNYGLVTSLALDPIEKKPLARFLPGKTILSVGSYGCNLRCPFCQNHEISQSAGDAAPLPPEQLVQKALALAPRGNAGLAFTYNEPAVGYEYPRDAGTLAHEAGLVNVMVTNGYFCAEALDELLPVIDAWNIDLKCFTEKGYRALGGGLETVKAAIGRVAASPAHLEVTTLVVPGLSDGEEDMAREAAWLASLSPGIPLHVSRSFPRWQSKKPPPSAEQVRRLADIAKQYLRHVYVGNC